MGGISLYDHQEKALTKMHNGCILCGGVGSGKSRTGLAYYFQQQGGNLDEADSIMKKPRDLYIITTAKKRDKCEWGEEMAPFLLSVHPEANYYKNTVVVDSWNNIAKYKDGKHAGEWTATGTQFQIPYVFKKLFSREEITFEDMCETKSVTSALYLDMNEDLPDVSEYEKEASIRVKIANWDYNRDGRTPPNQIMPDISDEELAAKIADGHSYTFVGKVGQFCPIKPGCNGGLLLREVIDKKTGAKSYATATGAKGYRWLESEMVKQLEKEDGIDRSYYDAMVDEAVHDISQYGDFEWFVSDDPYVQPNPSDDIPPWETPGEPWQAEPATAFDVR